MLTALSLFWFRRLAHVIPNHLLDVDPVSWSLPQSAIRSPGGRWSCADSSHCRSRPSCAGYVAGSGWKEYQRTGAICGIPLPVGLQEAEKLPSAIFTPSTKAPAGTHDENIPFAEAERLLGARARLRCATKPLRLYTRPPTTRAHAGIIIADTKFEFGTDADGASSI